MKQDAPPKANSAARNQSGADRSNRQIASGPGLAQEQNQFDFEAVGNMADFREYCADLRWFVDCGWLDLQRAVDMLEHVAWIWALPAQYGQDAVQLEMARAFEAAEVIAKPEPGFPAASTIDAFWYVVRNHSNEYLAAWFAEHPRDAPYLLKLWKKRQCAMAA